MLPNSIVCGPVRTHRSNIGILQRHDTRRGRKRAKKKSVLSSKRPAESHAGWCSSDTNRKITSRERDRWSKGAGDLPRNLSNGKFIQSPLLGSENCGCGTFSFGKVSGRLTGVATLVLKVTVFLQFIPFVYMHRKAKRLSVLILEKNQARLPRSFQTLPSKSYKGLEHRLNDKGEPSRFKHP